jgi:hypothetical protein
MSGLRSQFGSVDPKSLIGQGTEDEPLGEDVEDVTLDEDVSPDGESDESGDGDGDKEPEGRTIDNVYGELSRKQEVFQEKMMAKMGNILSTVTEALAAKPAGSQAQRTLEDYSVEELTAYRNNLPEDDPNRAGLDHTIADKIVDEKVRKQVQAITGRDRAESQRETAVTQAVERYPDLADEDSDFYQQVDAKIRKLDQSYVNANPRVVMDIANEVAIADGVKPTALRQTLRVPGKPNANRRDGGAPAPGTKVELKMSDQEARKIAKRLEGAMGRKFSDKEIQKIREDHQSYDENRNLFTR